MSFITFLCFLVMFGGVLFTGTVKKFLLNGKTHKLVIPRLYRPEMEFRNRFCDQNLDPECATKPNPGVGITEILVLYLNDKDEDKPFTVPQRWNQNIQKQNQQNQTNFCDDKNYKYDDYLNMVADQQYFREYMQSVDFIENGSFQDGYSKSELCYFQIDNSDKFLTPVRKIPSRGNDNDFTLKESPVKSNLKNKNRKGQPAHNYCNFKNNNLKIDKDHALYVLVKQKNKGELLL